MRKKSVSEIRKYRRFRTMVRLGVFLVIPLTFFLYNSLASDLNIIAAMLTIYFALFISLALGNGVLYFRFNNEQRRKILRFEERQKKNVLKNVILQLIVLVGISAFSQHLISFVAIEETIPVSIPVFILGFMFILFKPSIRSAEGVYDGDYDECGDDYRFSSSSPSQYDNFLMDPAHPSSVLNPTNPASPTYSSNGL